MAHNIYGPMAGRFVDLSMCPLWTDGQPDYYGQTRTLAEVTHGHLVDLAGGCIGVATREYADGSVLIAAFDPDGDGCETLATWIEDSDGERQGEPDVIQFQPFK